jgi:phage shock protein PspC (stress-responsive transcriptional regulator)
MTDRSDTRRNQTGTTLHRAGNDRIFAGVAGGLGEHFGVNAWWFRWAFIFLALFAGVGIFVYILAWLVIPGPGEEEPIAAQWIDGVDWKNGGTVFGIALVGVAGILLATQIFHISGVLILAGGMFIVGLLLYRGDLKVPQRPESTPPPAPGGETVDTEVAVEITEDGDSPGTTNVPLSSQDAVLAVAVASRDSSATGTPDPSPPPKARKPPKPPRERSMLGRLTIAIGLIVVATMALIEVSDLNVTIEPFYYFAAIIAVLGIGLVVGAWVGRARWLIIIGILITPMLWLSMLLPVSWNFSAGDFHHIPTTVQEVEGAYEQGIGQMTIDLNALSPSELTEVGMIRASLGLGEMVVRIPDGVGVILLADVTAGEVSGPFRTISGIGLDVTREFGPDPTVLVLDLEVGAGAIQISGPSDRVDDGFFIDDNGDITIIEGNN